MGYKHLAKEHLRSLVEQEPKREELRGRCGTTEVIVDRSCGPPCRAAS